MVASPPRPALKPLCTANPRVSETKCVPIDCLHIAEVDAAKCSGRVERGVAFVVYAVCSVPLVLVGVRCAGRRVRDSWLQEQEGRRRYQKDMLQAVAS